MADILENLKASDWLIPQSVLKKLLTELQKYKKYGNALSQSKAWILGGKIIL